MERKSQLAKTRYLNVSQSAPNTPRRIPQWAILMRRTLRRRLMRKMFVAKTVINGYRSKHSCSMKTFACATTFCAPKDVAKFFKSDLPRSKITGTAHTTHLSATLCSRNKNTMRCITRPKCFDAASVQRKKHSLRSLL